MGRQRITEVLVLVCSLLVYSSCTRKAAESTSRLTIQFPNASNDAVNNISSQKTAPNVSGKPNFNYQNAPAQYSDVDCLIVFIGGPEDAMRSGYCEKSEDKSQHFKFGLFAGTIAKDQTVTLNEVPSGSGRYVRLYGMKKSDPAKACPALQGEGAESALSGFSAPYFLGESAPTEMPPGATVTVNLPVAASIDSVKFFNDCRGPGFGSGGSGGGGGDGSNSNQPYVRLEGLHSFNAVENPTGYRSMARGACYPVTFKAFKPCSGGGICEPYVLNNPATFDFGSGIKFFTTETNCRSDLGQLSSVTISAGQTQFPITGNYYMRIPISNVGMVTTNLQGEVSLQANSEVTFTQSAHTSIQIDKPKIVVTNPPASLTYGSCASGVNTDISVFEDSAATFPMYSHETINFEGVFLEAKSLGCGAAISNILPSLATVSVNLAKPTATSSGFNAAVKAIAIDPVTSKYYVGGLFTTYGGRVANRIVRLFADGRFDADFKIAGGFDSAVGALVPDGAGGVFVGGSFTTYNGVTVNKLVHLFPDGSLDSNFSFPVAGTQVTALLLNGNFLYVGGTFTNVGGVARSNLAKLDLSSNVVSSWNPDPNGGVNAFESSGSNIIIGGLFTTVGGFTRNRVAYIDETSGSIISIDPNLNNSVMALKLIGTTLYIGGNFTTVNGGTTRNRLASVDVTTGNVTSWNPNVAATVNAIVGNAARIFFGGTFSTVGVTARNRVAAVDTATGALVSWDSNVSGTAVSAMAFDGSAVTFGGVFTSISSGAATNFATADYTVGTRNPTVLDPFWGLLYFNPLLFNYLPIYISP